MQSVVAGKLDVLPALLAKADQPGATQLLCTVKGIGPKVASNALMLMK
ncbi:MAG: hypothetical protein FJ087_18490 [Deltaproteobacteria bacterium]|nr:hypothetical protein [Deltaproteobacteria bacterium]